MAIPTAAEIVQHIDQNMTFDSRTMDVTMTNANPKKTRTFQMQIWGRGEDQAAILYKAPERDSGTKMLRVADELWVYTPAAETTQKISGHMLRQGMMGTDVSYEDMMAAGDLFTVYDATNTGEVDCGTGDGRKCWRLEMTAKDPAHTTYPKRVSLIDEEYYIAVKQELYAVSGTLLKTWTMSGIQKFDTRYFPTKMVIQDSVLQGSSTTLEFSNIVFGPKLDDETFSTRWLERQ